MENPITGAARRLHHDDVVVVARPGIGIRTVQVDQRPEVRRTVKGEYSHLADVELCRIGAPGDHVTGDAVVRIRSRHLWSEGATRTKHVSLHQASVVSP